MDGEEQSTAKIQPTNIHKQIFGGFFGGIGWYRLVDVSSISPSYPHIFFGGELHAHCVSAKQHPPVLVSTTMDQRLKKVISLKSMGIQGCTGDARFLGCD